MVDFDWWQDRFGRRDHERVINGLRRCVAKAIALQCGQVFYPRGAMLGYRTSSLTITEGSARRLN